MSRRRRNRRNENKRIKRYANRMSTFNQLFYDSLIRSYRETLKRRPVPDFINDLRTYRPMMDRGFYKMEDGRIAKYALSKNIHNITSMPRGIRLAFRSARRVSVCIRRKARREVLFAQKRVGKGKKVSSERKWTERSNIIC